MWSGARRRARRGVVGVWMESPRPPPPATSVSTVRIAVSVSVKGLPRGVRKLFLEVRQGAELRPQLDGATAGVAYGFGEAIGGRRDGRSAPPTL